MSPVLSLLAEEVGEEEGEGEGEGEEHHLVSHPCGHWTLRQLLAYDNEQVDSGGKGMQEGGEERRGREREERREGGKEGSGKGGKRNVNYGGVSLPA